MVKPSKLGFDRIARDFLINESLLLSRLRVHEDANPSMYMPSFDGEAGSADHLLLEAPPDLGETHYSLYLCGYCGGYDGSPIGVRIHREQNQVIWSNLGCYIDVDEPSWHSFKKITGFTFEWTQYYEAIKRAASS